MTPMRSMKTLTATALTVATAASAFGLTACGSTTSTSTPASKAPASHSQPAPAHTAPSQADLLSQWVGGPGYQDMLTVVKDLQQTGTDADNQNLAAVEADGSTLQADARTSQANPPPLSATIESQWQQAMADYATAGALMAQGDITGATTSLNAGNVLMTNIDTALGVTPSAS